MINSTTSARSSPSDRSLTTATLTQQPQGPLANTGSSNDGSSHGDVNEQEPGLVDGAASTAPKPVSASALEAQSPLAVEDLAEGFSLSEDLSGLEIQVPRLERAETGHSRRSSRRPFSESGKSISSSVLAQIIDSSIGSDFPWEEQEDEDKNEKPGANELRRTWMTTRRMPSSSTTLRDASFRAKQQEQELAVGVPEGSFSAATGAGVTPDQILQEEMTFQEDVQSPGAYACAPGESALQEDTAGAGEPRVDGSDVVVAEVAAPSSEQVVVAAPQELPRSIAAAAEIRSNPGTLTSVDSLSHALGSHEFFTTATAFQVDESQAEDEMRRRILSEAVEANVVVSRDEDDLPARNKGTWKILSLILVLILVVVGVGIILTVVLLGKDNDNSRDQQAAAGGSFRQEEDFLTVPTMELVRKRGFLRCGDSGIVPGFSYPNAETGVMEGLNVDYVRHIFRSLSLFPTCYLFRN